MGHGGGLVKMDPKFDRTKTTMPGAVLGHLEEACVIVSRHAVLSSVYSELLLKVAWYIAELDGLHARCRLGEGFFPRDDVVNDAKQARRQQVSTIVSKAELRSLEEKGLLSPVFGDDTVMQCS